jgi:hypothetical protein
MSVGKNIGLDHDAFSDRSFDWKTASVNLRRHIFYDNA